MIAIYPKQINLALNYPFPRQAGMHNAYAVRVSFPRHLQALPAAGLQVRGVQAGRDRRGQGDGRARQRERPLRPHEGGGAGAGLDRGQPYLVRNDKHDHVSVYMDIILVILKGVGF